MGRDLPSRVSGAARDAEQAIVEHYSRATPIRALVAGIPGIGSSLDAFLGTRGQNVSQRRLEATIDALKEEFSTVDAEKLDREFLDSEEFYDLVWRVFEKGQRTRDQERRATYARILRNGVEDLAFRDEAESALDLIAELHAQEFRLAAALFRLFGSHEFDATDLEYRFSPQFRESRAVRGRTYATEGATDEESRLYRPHLVSRLEAKGVVSRRIRVPAESLTQHMGALLGTGGYRSTVEVTAFQLTPHFCALMARLWPDLAAPEDFEDWWDSHGDTAPQHGEQ